VVFDFEVDFFAEHGIEAKFVGHPLLDELDVPGGTPGRRNGRCLGLLPGSRRVEAARLLPVMLEAGRILRNRFEDLSILVSSAATVEEQVVRDLVEGSGLQVETVRGSGRDVLSRSDAALVASGTATLECCVFGIPMAVLYKVSLASYLAARRMVKVPFVSLVNLVAGREVVPEFMQSDAVPEKVAECVSSLLEGPGADEMKKDLREVRSKLGEPGASDRAADEILKLIR
jgi:lipid-A-disaccharide synthase